MATDMETTGAWLPDESFLSDRTWMSCIKAHIKAFFVETAKSGNSRKNDESFFIGSFCTIIHQSDSSDPMKKTEALKPIQGMAENFSHLCKFQPPSM